MSEILLIRIIANISALISRPSICNTNAQIKWVKCRQYFIDLRQDLEPQQATKKKKLVLKKN